MRLSGPLILTALTAGHLGLPNVSASQHPDDYRVLGSPQAQSEMVVFSDFECPYCRNFALAALPALIAEFVATERLRVRYVFFPLAAIHPNAVSSAKAAHCAGQHDRFWAYHDYLFVRQPEWSGEPAPDSLWIEYAANLQLDTGAFAACLRATDAQSAVEADLRLALGAGVTGTPTIVLDGESIAGFQSYEELRHEILAALEKSRD